MVGQGTVALNYEYLLIPTLKAFAEEQETLVVSLLGVRGASLPKGIKMPKIS